MNTHQKIAFGTAGVLAVALLIVWGFDLGGLVALLLAAVATALLTLPVTWRLIFSLTQLIGSTFSLIGHTVGKIGDWTADTSWAQKQKFARTGSVTAAKADVPAWDSPELVTVGGPSPSKGNTSSGFLADTMDRQN